jgi:hypothetical protein
MQRRAACSPAATIPLANTTMPHQGWREKQGARRVDRNELEDFVAFRATALYWVIMRQADEALKVLEAELGVSPVRRGRATKVTREKKIERASDRYLTPATGDRGWRER